MLDTNILIYLLKNRPPSIAERIDALSARDSLCMSYVTWAELLKGAERSSKKPSVLRQLENLSQTVAVAFPSEAAICEHYAWQFIRLKDAGTPIGGNDLWIGCHALAEQATLVTNNTAEFSRLEGLVFANWTH